MKRAQRDRKTKDKREKTHTVDDRAHEKPLP